MASGAGAYGNIAIGATAAQIVPGRSLRDSVVIQNVHATQVLYLGTNASVTTANGLKLLAGESVRLELAGPVYGIASGADTDVRFFEGY
jgi:hypothetical protein